MLLKKIVGKPTFYHVMWQPTIGCKNNCRNCYIKKSVAHQTKAQTNSTEIVDMLFNQRQVDCGQFTIGLDDLDNYPLPITTRLKALWNELNSTKTIHSPALCITANGPHTITKWQHELDIKHLDQFIAPLSMVSIEFTYDSSAMGKLVDSCRRCNVVLNLNLVVRPNSISFMEGYSSARVDQIHLLLEKNKLGSAPAKSAITEYRKAVKQLQILPIVHHDKCVQATLERKLNPSSTCMAGLGIAHVWPDGSVTGCPYDSSCISGYRGTKGTLFQRLLNVNQKGAACMANCKISKNIWENING